MSKMWQICVFCFNALFNFDFSITIGFSTFVALKNNISKCKNTEKIKKLQNISFEKEKRQPSSAIYLIN